MELAGKTITESKTELAHKSNASTKDSVQVKDY